MHDPLIDQLDAIIAHARNMLLALDADELDPTDRARDLAAQTGALAARTRDLAELVAAEVRTVRRSALRLVDGDTPTHP